jgi:DNA-binding NtrC family response regulator
MDPRHRMNLKVIEKSLIREALTKHRGNRAFAVKELGINLGTLYRRIQQLGISSPERDGRGRRS